MSDTKSKKDLLDDSKTEDNLDKTSIVTSDTFKIRLAQAGDAPPCLVLLVGPAANIGRQWPVEDTDRIIGRSINSHIFVDDKSMSKSHAKLSLISGDVNLMDLESTNYTIINGKRLDPLRPVKLRNNDQIKCGNIIFKFLEKGNIETVSVAETFDRGSVDQLTQIHNKGALMAKGPEFFKKSGLLGVPYSVITFDIDHFKKVNDTHGHTAGDFILTELAHIIKSGLIRENDFFARSGGEEFSLLLLGNKISQSQDIAERIRSTIENHTFNFEGINIPITVSLGGSLKVPGDIQWENIFERADKALYESKNNGRNQVNFQ